MLTSTLCYKQDKPQLAMPTTHAEMPVEVLATILPTRLSLNAPGKPTGSGPGTWVPSTYM